MSYIKREQSSCHSESCIKTQQTAKSTYLALQYGNQCRIITATILTSCKLNAKHVFQRCNNERERFEAERQSLGIEDRKPGGQRVEGRKTDTKQSERKWLKSGVNVQVKQE